MPAARTTPFDLLLTSARELQTLERWHPLERTLSRALAAVVSDAQGQAVLSELLSVPEHVRRSSPAWQTLSVWAWSVNRQPEAVVAFAEASTLASEAEVYLAWALVRVGRAAQAQTLLERLWPQLSGEALGFAWRVRAQVLSALGQSGWADAFEQASQQLTGRRRSLSLSEQGHALDEAGHGLEARDAWRAALDGFDGDAFHQAWLRFNLGMSAFRDGSPDAEQHLLILTELARHPQARPFASRAWTGLGTVRRMYGEWDRAEAAYRAALRLAGSDRDDELQAWRGLGHVRRLRGLPESSLEEFGRAAALSKAPMHWIFTDIAAVWAQLGQPGRAAQALGQTGPLTGPAAARALLVRAELARAHGHQHQALDLLAGLKVQAIWAREEHGCFPELFALAQRAGLPVPLPLAYAPQAHVDVRAAGVLQVQVNGRAVPLSPTSRAAEVLVALLELGHQASTEVLLDMLFPDAPPGARGPQQQLSALVVTVRQVLGWPGSVRSRRGAYQLDPEANWQYDMETFRRSGQIPPAFLEGIYRNWVQERQPRG